MPRIRKPARAIRWKGAWHVFHTDYSAFPPVQRRVLCEGLGATTAEQRTELVRQYRARELREQHESVYRAGGSAYDVRLLATLDEYEADVAKRVQARESSGVRVGLAEASGVRIQASLRNLRAFVANRRLDTLRCGDLTARHVEDFIHWLAVNRGERSEHTLNLDLRNLRTFVNWLARLRPARLREPSLVSGAIKMIPAQPPAPTALSPVQLQAFWQTARQHSPRVAPLFRFLAVTGCRRGEALALHWADVDLERGRVTFRAQKTGRYRILPLVGAPEGDVAPLLLAEMRAWRQADPHSETVFSHFPGTAWDNVSALAQVHITPQELRQNFTSYAASLGIPPAVCALWQGHSVAVAERFYRAQVLDRLHAATLEGAMGFSESDIVNKA